MNSYSLAYIGLGSNLDNPPEQIKAALRALENLPECQQLHCAPWYQSVAIGPGEQPDYINTVARLETRLSPRALLEQLQSIENRQGRQRNIRWGARTLDLDLLLYDNETLDSDISLQVPHPEIAKRSFVLLPLFDLAPDLTMPNGVSLADLVRDCDNAGLTKIKD